MLSKFHSPSFSKLLSCVYSSNYTASRWMNTTNKPFSERETTKDYCLFDEIIDSEDFIKRFEIFEKKFEISDAYALKKEKSNNHQDSHHHKKELDAIIKTSAEIATGGVNCFFQDLQKLSRIKLARYYIFWERLNKISNELMMLLKINDIVSQKLNKNQSLINFFISLDYLAKGFMNHWKIKERDNCKLSSISQFILKICKKLPCPFKYYKYLHDSKVSLLIGDRYHTEAYYLTAQTGKQPLYHALSSIDENFSKIYLKFDMKDKKEKAEIFKKIYEHSFYFLPSFFGHSLKALALCHLTNNKEDICFEIGKSYGYLIQFSALFYFFTARLNERKKNEALGKIKNLGSLLEGIIRQWATIFPENIDLNELYLWHETFLKLSFFQAQILENQIRANCNLENPESSLHYLIYIPLFEMLNYLES